MVIDTPACGTEDDAVAFRLTALHKHVDRQRKQTEMINDGVIVESLGVGEE